MFQKYLTKTFLLLARYAAEPEDSEEWRIKKITFVSVALGAALGWLGFGLLYLTLNERTIGLFTISGFILIVLSLIGYRIYRRYTLLVYFGVIVHTLGITIIHLLLGGFVQSGMVIVWILISPMLLIVGYKPHHGLIMMLVVAIIFPLVAILQPYYLRISNNIPPNVITALFVVNTLGVATYMILAVYYFVWRNEILSKLVFGEQEKSEALLLNILPKEIVAVLKNENRVIADQFDSASILFADVVNFTPMSARMTPTELVELLNEVYSYFDTLVEKYGLEKIKTIGDCYMVASGVPRRRPDHALVLTMLALEIRDYVNKNEFHGHKLTFRIGLNSGSVVAGVIGKKKFAYDLWGDAVNTASRMESSSAGGSIQVTEATYDLIKEEFVCDPRGTIQVKGKGEMPVWFVMEKR